MNKKTHRLRTVTAVALALALAAGTLTSCSTAGKGGESSPGESSSATSTKPEPTGEMYTLAKKAQEDMFKNFWEGEPDTGHMVREDHGYKTNGRQTMIWAHAMMLFGMETMYDLTESPELKNRIIAQWNFTKDNFTEEYLVRPGKDPNIAIDDAGWDAMAYMVWYRATGDEYPLRAAGKLIRNSYEYWKDGDVANGLWYPQTPPSQGGDATTRFKSLYSAAMILAALEYCEVTGDEEIYNDTMKVYEWIEEHLLRDGKEEYPGFTMDCDDNLYFCDYNEDREGRSEKTGPDGGTRPLDIKEAGSVSFLGGNMAMGVIHARLYKKTGEEKYLTRALETVRAISDGPYNVEGVLLNDRDAWTNGAFMGVWVKDVLTLPGVEQKDKDLIYNTARSIAQNSRTEEGYYGASWDKPVGTSKWDEGSKPEQIMTSATTTNVLMAAALLEGIEKEGAAA